MYESISVTKWFVFLLALSLAACQTQQLALNPGPQPVALASNAATDCQPVASEAQYYLLFGAYRFWGDPPTAVQLGVNTSYRLQDRMTWLDWTVTILGGWAVTVTRRTATLEQCSERVAIIGEAERQAQEREMTDQLVRARRGDSAVLLNNGDIVIGQITEVDDEQITIRTTGTIPEDAERLDEVRLLDGSIIHGEILRQSRTEIVMRVEDQNRVIQKSDIHQLRYNVPAEQTTSQTVEIPRADILKIRLP
ncbi:MAG: hypothetical protein KDK34_06610 [Leptospiraceae bacterium]|nr:hypothetical protein [Leptospiraceae bacterium]